MGLASALNAPSMAIQYAIATLPGNERLLLSHSNSRPTHLYLPLRPPPRFSSILALARRRNHNPASSSSSKKKNKKSLAKNRVMEDEDDIDEDAFEALFNQLEEDLKNDDISLDNGDDDEDITEEDLAMLEQELAEAFGAVDSENEDEEGDDDEEEEEEPPVKLKNWQIRRLASALKAGRRKTSSLLCCILTLPISPRKKGNKRKRRLNRQLAKFPLKVSQPSSVLIGLLFSKCFVNPPNLLMMSATLPDEPSPTVSVIETKPIETVVEITADTAKPDTNVKVPIHVLQQKFSAQKRLKKMHVQTLESVYRRTKRPTNAMVSSIVQVTNLPRKRIVRWFEDRRAEDGVPQNRVPYQRSSIRS
ncbi:hypothetical protein FNV43_RR12318 [Rhamnella rubrinervis]|uniref:Homeobox domain-containing protein n=1 Tax=Rhamnella rubrinervis TaxID=2594499 RepID=A0A8K0H7Q9_9ROSA|nr:hypothetical protein FNV43_RR12318 [Rhamnella rubrinervis]